MIQLRDYQEECVNNILSMKVGEKKIACLPTGAGKTILMSEVCRRVNSRILIVVMSKELREQTIDKLKMVCGESVDVGSVQGNLKEWDNRIIVATRQTLTSGNKPEFRFLRLLQQGEFEYVLIDECHCATKQQKTIIKNLNKNIKLVGFTATPYNMELKKIYNGFVYKRELIDMIKEKYLVEPVCYQVQTDADISNVKVVRGDFVEKQLSDAVNTDYRNNLIVKSYIDKCQADGRNKTIVFCTTVEHSKNLAECFCKNGIKATSIDGSLNKKDREKILKDFHEGKYQVICNCNILTIGFDEPSTDSVIIARPTKSRSLYLQIIGRGLRLSPKTGKKDCLIIDVVDVINTFDIISSKTIFDEKLHYTKQKYKEKINKEHIETLENKIIEEIKNQENININNINISYIKENILIKRDIKEKYYQYNNTRKYNKKIKKNTDNKKIIFNLFRKIFKIVPKFKF